MTRFGSPASAPYPVNLDLHAFDRDLSGSQAIPPDAIAEAVGKTDSMEERSWQTAVPTGSLSGNRHVSVVI